MARFGGDQVAVLCLLAIAIAIAWNALRRKQSLQIVVQNGRVTDLRGVAKVHARRVTEFLERDVALGGKVTVLGSRDAQGVLRLDFRGKIDEGTRQQIRNYLKMTL